jgi:vacuolar-type H+-ATPase subunit E/Vma4
MDRMFQLDIVTDPYPDEEPTITIVARSGNAIVGQTADAGRLDGQTSNGEFTLVWTPTTVVMTVGKSGDGRGGTLSVTLERNEDVDNSFAAVLEAWQTAARAYQPAA